MEGHTETTGTPPASVPFIPKVTPTTFDGTGKPADTLVALEHLRRYHAFLLAKGAPLSLALEHTAGECLEGSAATWWSTVRYSVVTFDQFVHAFKERFLRDTDCLTAGRRVLYGLRQGSKSSAQYHEELVKSLETLRVVGFDWAVHGPKLAFLNGLSDDYKNILITRADIADKDIEEMAAILRNAEAAGSLGSSSGGAGGPGNARRYDSNRFPRRSAANASAHSPNNNPNSNSSDAAPRSSSAGGPPRRAAPPGGGNGGGGRPYGSRGPRDSREPRDLSRIACNRCGQLGHIAANCDANVAAMQAHRARKQ